MIDPQTKLVIRDAFLEGRDDEAIAMLLAQVVDINDFLPALPVEIGRIDVTQIRPVDTEIFRDQFVRPPNAQHASPWIGESPTPLASGRHVSIRDSRIYDDETRSPLTIRWDHQGNSTIEFRRAVVMTLEEFSRRSRSGLLEEP